jgi:hypothetical protein
MHHIAQTCACPLVCCVFLAQLHILPIVNFVFVERLWHEEKEKNWQSTHLPSPVNVMSMMLFLSCMMLSLSTALAGLI